MKRKRGKVIAIDGPAGAGKSTVAKRLAKALNYDYVDTGAIYRSVALVARERGVLSGSFTQGSDEDRDLKRGAVDDALAAIIDELLNNQSIRFAWQGDNHQVILGSRDVSQAIRVEANSQAASSLSSRPVVRDRLLDFQRALAKDGGAVLEGRDTGTVVFPDAELKIFLSATSAERARRRFQEQQAKGFQPVYADVLKAIEERDRQNTERAQAPLKKAGDAHDLDTTELSIDQVVERILALVASA